MRDPDGGVQQGCLQRLVVCLEAHKPQTLDPNDPPPWSFPARAAVPSAASDARETPKRDVRRTGPGLRGCAALPENAVTCNPTAKKTANRGPRTARETVGWQVFRPPSPRASRAVVRRKCPAGVSEQGRAVAPGIFMRAKKDDNTGRGGTALLCRVAPPSRVAMAACCTRLVSRF